MNLRNFLTEKKTLILSKWFNLILDTYPPETAKFFRNQDDPFRNPVGSTIFVGIEKIFDEIIKEKTDVAKLSIFLEEIIKIRAVQDFSASQAIAFIFSFKDILKDEINQADLLQKPATKEFLMDLHDFQSKIDLAALISFDIYMKCREKLYELKANEAKKMTYRLLQQAKLIVESPERDIN
ncbi:MAG: RsbRD N-terminal domain-containing protein [Thermodesulfovibrionales bacterium]|nr:RsbRD N-terminal domain-containing protein [Thermodesulfovibrionales bacterium]